MLQEMSTILFVSIILTPKPLAALLDVTWNLHTRSLDAILIDTLEGQSL